MAIKFGILIYVCIVPSVFCQQLAPGQLKQKVDEIAKAYAEGYKAAITAIRARSMIPNRPAPMRPQVNPRSVIPKPVASTVIKTAPSVYSNGFAFPGRQITVNGIEKSGIPRPRYQAAYPRDAVPKSLVKPIGHKVVARSAAPPPLLGKFMAQQTGKKSTAQQRSSMPKMINGQVQPSEEKAEEMARLNAAARHRNVYFDAMGGDPYGGSSGVLSHQNINFARNRRSLAGNLRHHLRRHRRGRVPYFGQDLDKLGVVRAVPVMKGPDKSPDIALPSFMKVHAAEFGSVRSHNNAPVAMVAERRDAIQPQQQPQY